MTDIQKPQLGAHPAVETQESAEAKATDSLGQIKSGPVSTIKAESQNGKVVVAKAQQAAVEAAANLTAGPGQILYIKKGYPVFNTATGRGQRISFSGGKYIVDKADPLAPEICECLDYYVDVRKILEKEDGDAEGSEE